MTTFAFQNRAPSVKRPPRRRCIYCDSLRYRSKDERALGDEHVLPESLGGTLVLQQAACEACERAINNFEQPILRSVLYAPRIHMGIRRKRRKRGEETIKVQGKVDGRDVELVLPVKKIPVLLFLMQFGPPGILINRPAELVDVRGAWLKHLSPGPIVPSGFESFASPILDTFKFSQFLAKIAHCFAADQLGDKFTPLLLDLIRMPANSQRFDLIGGDTTALPPTGNLHELGLEWRKIGDIIYVIVRIRFFANLGAPTYLVVAGTTESWNDE